MKLASVALVLAGYCLAQDRWRLVKLPPPDQGHSEAVFSDDGNGWIASGRAWLTGTRDGGQTWQNVPAVSSGTLDSIAVTPGGALWATGRVYPTPESPAHAMSVSRDKGVSWTEVVRVTGPQTWLGPVWFLNETHGWAVGSQSGVGVLWATSDAGNSWSIIFQDKDDLLKGVPLRVRFVSEMDGWMIAPGTISRTEDGGRTWSVKYRLTMGFLETVEIASDGSIWVAGGWNVLLCSRDNGETWLQGLLPSGIESYFTNVRFLGTRGWVAGSGGSLLSTTDYGRTWEREILPVGDETVLGWITASKNGMVMVLTDSGSAIRLILE